MFWRITLRTYATIMHATQRRLVDEHNCRLSLAWHIDAFHRQKQPQKHSSIMRPYPRTRPQTVEEQRRVVRQMVERFKGI